MKTQLIRILNNCVFNKPIHQFDSIANFIRTIQKNDVTFNSIIHDIDIDIPNCTDESIFISFWIDNDDRHKLISVLFSNSDYIGIHNECGCNDSFYNDKYNTQYDEIKELLLSEGV